MSEEIFPFNCYDCNGRLIILNLNLNIRRVHVCLAVTCHLFFWQNDRGILRATVVTRV